ncbi:MAG: hypothetical protein IPI59_14680 [Sphingobacteriales bacterium]|jgi:photosystem II stability/assembly factor-like uncharacterized protein|nr:hypothetical protein [Sphingobacteriales bacterium]MBP9141878.1 hypothetical protein [Chitinophagales bacterium]MDA0199292.1 hypothetical protein [Bacteroidota bacterium]MBK6888740.1 hypothetical protein [Sphingobacteriales bacterium]MBK7528753.1 hypothetical protein [Sphingobacteriales bacterium]
MKHVFTIITLAVVVNLFSVPLTAQPAAWLSKGIGGGGAFFMPSINPANQQHCYIASDMGGVYHTTDFGNTYSMVNFAQLLGGTRAKVHFTATSGLMYALDKSNNMVRLYKTIDDGITWAPVTTNLDPSDEIFYLAVDYNNPSHIIITLYNQLYFSNDGGANFTLKYTGNDPSSGLILAGVFFDNTNIYAGTNNGLLTSSNSGTTFGLASYGGIPAAQQIYSMAGAKQSGTVRLFALTVNNGTTWAGQMYCGDFWGMAKGVYKIEPGSMINWAAAATGIDFSTQFAAYLDMAANDINTVYLAGLNDLSHPMVLKTTNAGTNWNNVLMTVNNQNIITGWQGYQGDSDWWYGECALGFTVCPNNANLAIITDLGFAHFTDDGGANWRQAYVNAANQHAAGSPTPKNQNYGGIGFENTSCWQVYWHSADDMFACFSDITGIKSNDAGQTWNFNYTGNNANTTYRMVKHNTDAVIFAATSGIHDMYQSTRLRDNPLDNNDAEGKIIYSTNGGASFTSMHTFNHPVIWLATDPNNNNRLYASVIHSTDGGIFVSNNIDQLAASTWAKLPNPPRTEGHPFNIVVLNDGKVVCTYSGRRTSGGSFTASSGVFIYDPNANTWADVSDADMYYWTKDIIIDPNDPNQNTWYVCVFSGWGGPPNGLGGIYRTTNRGTSWAKISGSTFDRVGSLSFNPNNLTQAYITTEGQGLYLSNNITDVTPNYTWVSNYPFHQPERVFFNPYDNSQVWVTSFGGGLNMGNLCTFTPEITGNQNPCKDNQYTYSVPAVAGAVYNWSVSGNGSVLSGLNTNSIVVQWNSGAVGQVSIVQINP